MSVDSLFSEHAPDWLQPPDDTPEFMHLQWLGCLQWAITFDLIIKRFEADTGTKLSLARSPIEAMIDDTTGHKPAENYLRAFVPWFNEWVWGTMDGDAPK